MFARHQVNNPLKMKEKTHELVAHQDIIVETQVQNATPRTLFLESIRFIPAPQFEVFRFAEHGVIVNESDSKDTDAGAEPESPNPSGVRLATLSDVSSATRLAGTIPDGSVVVGTRMATLGPMANLKEGDVEQECDHPERSGIDLFFGVPPAACACACVRAQYMFRLRGKLPPSQLKRTTALGRMEVVWKSAMGEHGKLQSNVVQRKLPTARAVEVSSMHLETH